MNAIEFERVSKSYAVYESRTGRLTELATFGAARRHRDFHALTDLTFSVARGEVFCIIGENGSGKSTTLQLIAGIFAPTAGDVRVNGRVAALLELGAGFNPEFTGRENVYMNGAILGFSKKELDARYRSIEEFAAIGNFIEEPVRTYSSGMAVRLAFSVAIHADPEILVVDEALAVGDAWFRQKCMRRINELRDGGVTIVFVSHSTADVRAIGDRALWLEHGRMRAVGGAAEVMDLYLAAADPKSAPASAAATSAAPRAKFAPATQIPNMDGRSGDGGAEILGIALMDEFGDPLHLLIPGARILVRVSARAGRDLPRPDLGVRLRNHLGLDFAATSAAHEGHAVGAMRAGEAVTVDFHFEVPELYPGTFSFSPWIVEGNAVCDFVENAITIPMARGDGPVYGYLRTPCHIEVHSVA
ncbi:MAG TPA: ABC transporter ATP-binding protein [Bryobacteraceae bacterium]|nr:ABC transporter ATP-binding protein [Bryobacteraceae bacterium]